MKRPDRIPAPPTAVPGAPGPLTATGRALRWGVVSTGSISATVTADIARLEDAVLHAVSSRSADSAAAFAARFGFGRSYADEGAVPGYELMFADSDIDVVYVAAPHGQHHQIAKAALLAGKHVLCEKALTINSREAAELIELARGGGLFLMEAVWTRFLPSVNRAWDIVHSGELGTIQWLHADLGFPAPPDPASRLWNPVAGGGALLDLTVYPLTWAVGTLGFPSTVSAAGTLNDDGVDAQNALTLGYHSGAQALLMSSLAAASPQSATICGTLGWLRTAAPLHNPGSFEVHVTGREPRTETFERAGNYAYELREVTRCIQSGMTESPTMPWQDSLDTMRLFDGVRAQLGVRYPND